MNTFEDGFYFGAGFAVSQLIFILIILVMIGVPILATLGRDAFRRKKTLQAEKDEGIYPPPNHRP